MIRKLCDYQNRLKSDEFIRISYNTDEEHQCIIHKKDVLVPCSGFIEIIRENTYPFLLNIERINWARIEPKSKREFTL